MKIGYARASIADPEMEEQRVLLQARQCEVIHFDPAINPQDSAFREDGCFKNFARGDTLYVTSLDRIAQSVEGLMLLFVHVKSKEARLVSIAEEINTQLPPYTNMERLLAVIVEFEREVGRERTILGLQAAKARGNVGGRARLLTPDQEELARYMYHQQGKPIREICRILGISKNTLYRTTGARRVS